MNDKFWSGVDRKHTELINKIKTGGFYKVQESGGSYVTNTFYNPVTHETLFECVRDYDYADASRDIDELYYMPINDDVRREYLHHNGNILVGDTVKVIKGRKVPVGTIAVINDIRPYKDRYGRIQSYYAYLDNGMRTSIDNCILYVL